MKWRLWIFWAASEKSDGPVSPTVFHFSFTINCVSVWLSDQWVTVQFCEASDEKSVARRLSGVVVKAVCQRLVDETGMIRCCNELQALPVHILQTHRGHGAVVAGCCVCSDGWGELSELLFTTHEHKPGWPTDRWCALYKCTFILQVTTNSPSHAHRHTIIYMSYAQRKFLHMLCDSRLIQKQTKNRHNDMWQTSQESIYHPVVTLYYFIVLNSGKHKNMRSAPRGQTSTRANGLFEGNSIIFSIYSFSFLCSP